MLVCYKLVYGGHMARWTARILVLRHTSNNNKLTKITYTSAYDPTSAPFRSEYIPAAATSRHSAAASPRSAAQAPRRSASEPNFAVRNMSPSMQAHVACVEIKFWAPPNATSSP